MCSASLCRWKAAYATLSRSLWCSASPCFSTSSTISYPETASAAPSSVSQLTNTLTVQILYINSITVYWVTKLSCLCHRNPLRCLSGPHGIEHAGVHDAGTVGQRQQPHFLLQGVSPRKLYMYSQFSFLVLIKPAITIKTAKLSCSQCHKFKFKIQT